MYKGFLWNPIIRSKGRYNEVKKNPLLEAIIKVYGFYPGSTLEEMTHAELPWKNHFQKGKYSNKIPVNEIETYFEEGIFEGIHQRIHQKLLNTWREFKYKPKQLTEQDLEKLGVTENDSFTFDFEVGVV